MSQRFIRCGHCGYPHDVHQTVCPITGKPVERRRGFSSAPRMPAAAPVTPPPPPSRPPASRPAPLPPPKPMARGRERDLTGKTIGGKYIVRSVLGEGGMGTVFEAEHIAIGRVVAVKILHPAQARKKVAVKRFHQEARAAAAIGHPNICEVYDLGTLDDGSPYLVMERLVGETLADRIASEGGLPFDDVLDVLAQVLSGLTAAHEKGIVHRDIKPENIFLTKPIGCPPVAKLLDFGVSKMITPLFGGEKEDLDLTRTGMVMGTPFYMSPEQARGDRDLDARVDLYACGIILYEALTGRRPFHAPNYNALLMQILTGTPRQARDLRPALPNSFDEVINKSMARASADRYQNAAEFQRDLQSLRDRYPKQGLLARSEPPPPPLVRASSPRLKAASISPAVDSPEVSRMLAPAALPRVARSPSIPSGTPSSVEIPVHFGTETPMSGELAYAESTWRTDALPSSPDLRDPDEITSTDALEGLLGRSDEHELVDDFPTEVRAGNYPGFPLEDATQKHGPPAFESRSRKSGDVLTSRRPPSMSDRAGRPDGEEDNTTLIKSNMLDSKRRLGLSVPRPQGIKPTAPRAGVAKPAGPGVARPSTASPDDTVRMEELSDRAEPRGTSVPEKS